MGGAARGGRKSTWAAPWPWALPPHTRARAPHDWCRGVGEKNNNLAKSGASVRMGADDDFLVTVNQTRGPSGFLNGGRGVSNKKDVEL